jgi:hypothetical protein
MMNYLLETVIGGYADFTYEEIKNLKHKLRWFKSTECEEEEEEEVPTTIIKKIKWC